LKGGNEKDDEESGDVFQHLRDGTDAVIGHRVQDVGRVQAWRGAGSRGF